MTKKYQLSEFGFEVEIGKVAKQADGAVLFRKGGTVILSTAVCSPSKEFPGFFPLVVDYREQFSAAGKIPGGYYKREGKPTDREVLTSRLIDRSIRPLFPINYFDQVQVLNTVYSVDKENTPNAIALLASSIALSISPIPFLGPVGVVEIGRVEGEWIINPSYPESLVSDVRIVVVGTDEGICMVEGSVNELSEKELVDILFRAHEDIKKMVAWQLEIQKDLQIKKEYSDEDWRVWEKQADAFLGDDLVKNVYIVDKVKRNQYIEELQETFLEKHQEKLLEPNVEKKVVEYIFKAVLKQKITESVIKFNKRVDGRAFDQVRSISTEVGLLPFTHGSALFTRGQTQALTTVTLGGGQDEQRTESIMNDAQEKGSFMLHYNFPPFSVGEVRMLRGPGRREVGHGHLAASAFKYVLPTKEDFPYTIRIVSDILESNGSSSMATTCGSTMALMQAGVPIKKMVGGIAMGLLKNKEGSFAILSDITGFEDDFGLMDFKITGTESGITAIQLDVKNEGGFSRKVFEDALQQARLGRIHILNEMKKVMSAPNPSLSDLVPKVVSFSIHTDKIGAVIGGGGKTIREIIEVTGTSIDIEPDGLVKIFGGVDAHLDQAIRWVKTLAGQIETGSIYEGKIRRFADFGIFVELVPGLDGLVHISNIPRDLQKVFSRQLNINDVVKVEVLDYDDVSGRISLRLLTE